MTDKRRITGPLKRADWLPTDEQIEAMIADQKKQRIRNARRVDDGPLTIMVEDGFGRTPGFDKPVPWYLRAWRRFLRRACNVLH